MPSRNTVKEDAPDSYYHIYARGNSKTAIFVDDADYLFFQHLFLRYLSRNELTNVNGVPYPYYGDNLQLVAYCLMSNHFHLLVHQEEQGAMSAFMRSLMTSYSRYFNKKYKRTGSLFESRYKASRIEQQNYLEHISRYIHLNPRYWKRYKYSSINYYSGDVTPEWIQPSKILSMFDDPEDYLAFVADYEEHKAILDELKLELADT